MLSQQDPFNKSRMIQYLTIIIRRQNNSITIDLINKSYLPESDILNS